MLHKGQANGPELQVLSWPETLGDEGEDGHKAVGDPCGKSVNYVTEVRTWSG